METYNNLLAQFDAVLPPEDTLAHFKAFADQLSNHRGKRKMLYLIRKNELKTLVAQHSAEKLENSCIPATMRSLDTSSVDIFQTATSEKVILKSEIFQIQQKIQHIRKQTNQTNQQLRLIEQKKEQVEVLYKQTQLQMFNSAQIHQMEVAKINNQQYREQKIISQLKRNKSQIVDQINGLVRQQQQSLKIIERWNATKNVKVKTVKQFGVSPYALKQIITTLFSLKDIQNKYSKTQKFIKCQNFEALDFLKYANKKSEIIAGLGKNNIVFDQQFANQMISFYKKLEKDLDRNQRANKQIVDHLQTLHENYQITNRSLEKAYRKKQQQNQRTLKLIQIQLQDSEEKLCKSCNLITVFSTKLYFLLKKLYSLKKSIWRILSDIKSRLSNSVISQENEEKFLQNYESFLYSNPEDIQIKWGDSGPLKKQFYKNYIRRNDLLRIFSNPDHFCKENDDLDNLEVYITGCFKNVSELVQNMYIYLESYFKKVKNQPKMVKQQGNKENRKDFCIQSRQYYRRDDFKLLEKLQKNQHRKKGYLLQVPFNIKQQNELIIPTESTQNDKSFTSLCTPRKNNFNKKLMKYSSLLAKSEKEVECNSLRKMLSKLGKFGHRSSSKLSSIRQTLNITFVAPNESIQSAISSTHEKLSLNRLPRNTTGEKSRTSQRFKVFL